MYSKDGENYFIVDAHIALWDARPENQRNIHGKQFIDCFYDYHRNLSPGIGAVVLRGIPLPGRRTPHEGPVRPTATSTTRSSSRPTSASSTRTDSADRGGVRPRRGAPGQADIQPLLRPPQRRGRPGPAARGPREVRLQGREALHRGMARRLPGLQALRPVVLPVLRGVPRARHQEHPHPQGPDNPPARPGRLRRRRRRPRRLRLHRSQLRRRARRPAPAGGLLLDRHAGTQRPRRPGRRDAVHAHPAAVLRPDHRRAHLLDRGGPDPVLQRLRAVDAALARSSGSSTSRSPRT